MRTPKRKGARKQSKPRDGSTPYDDFAEHEERLRLRVLAVDPGWRWEQVGEWNKGGKGRKPQPLYVADLVVGLWAVECVGEKGLSYGQLARCSKVSRGVSCHNNKAAAIFSTLQSLGLIVKVGNYSAGAKGNCYAVVKEASEFMGIKFEPTPPTPAKRPPARLETINPKSPTHDDDPW